jgi:hypothetical protein
VTWLCIQWSEFPLLPRFSSRFYELEDARSCSICLSIPSFYFHLAWCLQSLSMLSQMTKLVSFKKLNNTEFYIHTIIYRMKKLAILPPLVLFLPIKPYLCLLSSLLPFNNINIFSVWEELFITFITACIHLFIPLSQEAQDSSQYMYFLCVWCSGSKPSPHAY